MKRRVFSLFLTLALLAGLCPLSVLAAEEETTRNELELLEETWITVDGIDGGEICFDFSTGTITDCEETVTKADIPETIDGVAVTSIGDYAFWLCDRLTSVSIPNSVTSIGEHSFCNCDSLMSISIPDSVTSIEGDAFFGCDSLMSISIPDSVTSIGDEAFAWCVNFTNITIPSSVTSIGDDAFAFCIYLMNITIPDSVTSIGEGTFYGCDNLTSITIPSSVTSIGEGAFGGCANLVSIQVESKNANYSSEDGVLFNKDKTTLIAYPAGGIESYTIPDGTISVADDAFYGCFNLTNITISNSVTSIGEWAFSDCEGLTSVSIPDSVTIMGDRTFYRCSNLESITLSSGLTSIGEAVFNECSSLTEINVAENNPNYSSIDGVLFNKAKTTLLAYPANGKEEYTVPDGVTSIGDYAFSGCSSVTSITIPDSVTSIGECAFCECTSLTSITIPDSVTSIGDYAFEDCNSVTSINIENGVTSIGHGAFINCSNLTSISIPASVTIIGDYAFHFCENLTSITIPDSVTSIGEGVFLCCTSLTSIAIPDSVTSIGKCAFFGCSSLTSISVADGNSEYSSFDDVLFNKMQTTLIAYPVGKSETSYTIPDSVTSIGDFAFDSCTNLTSITIPAGVTSIGEDAFYNCRSLTSIRLPDSVMSIGEGAFAYCRCLTNISLPTDVTSIGNWAFDGCDSLKNIYYGSSEDQWSEINIGDVNNALYEATIRYGEEFSTDEGWYTVPGVKDGKICFDSSTGTITDCENTVTEADIPATINDVDVTSIGERAFDDCDSLTSVTIPNSVKSIGDYAFDWCESLTSITIPDSVTSIGNGAFWLCDSLTSIIIPNSVTSIGEGAFCNCTNLTSLSIPASVTSVGNRAFGNCASLTSIQVSTENPNYTNLDGVLFNKTKTVLIEYPAGKSETSYTIPDSVTSIGEWAFGSCNNLTSITIPNSVTNIENWAFLNCDSLTSITIPDSVTSIGYSAFLWCDSLTNVTIPDSVTSIGERAFSGCDSLTDVYYDGSEDQWSEINIGEENDALGEATIHYEEEISTDEEWYTVPGVKDGKICFDSSTGTITDCENTVTEANIPATINDVDVTSIGESAFEDCDILTNISLPDSVTSIGAWAFAYCTILTSITIPNSVKSIGDDAFEYCNNLASITIPASVTSIGECAFFRCTSLTGINVAGGNSEYSSSDGVLFNKNQTTLIAYPAGKSETSYAIPASVTIIRDYAFADCRCLTNISLPDSVTSIGEGSFNCCDDLTSITIPASVTSIGECAFWRCTSLTSISVADGNSEYSSLDDVLFNKTQTTLIAYPVGKSETSYTIPDSVTSIEEGAFYNCRSLTSIRLPDSVMSIGEDAFADCRCLTNISLPDSVTSIGEGSFNCCDDLTSITIPASVTSIGECAFLRCTSLTSISVADGNSEYSSLDGVLFNKNQTLLIVYPAGKSETSYTIPDSVTSIGDFAFDSCTNLTSITIPASVTSIGEDAFSDCTNLRDVYYSGTSSGGGRASSEDDENLTQLDTPTDLQWNVKYQKKWSEEYQKWVETTLSHPGYISWKWGKLRQSEAEIKIYNAETGEPITINFWSFDVDDFNTYDSVDDFCIEDIGSGTYYFTVTALGDRTEYRDSETAISSPWTYTAPVAKRSTLTNPRWNGYTAEYDTPQSGEEEYGYGSMTQFYFSETPTGEKWSIFGSWHSGDYSCEWDFDEIEDRILEEYGSGYYFFRVRLLSNDITQIRNGDWSEYSPALYISGTDSEVATAVSDILSDLGDEPDRDEILDALSELNFEDLRVAMAADTEDDGIVSDLEELEEKCGGQASIAVDEDLENTFDAEKVSIVGANLNQLVEDDADTTLNITKADKKDVDETVYNNTVAVSFSMDIENVENTENLNVPVKITLPVPTGINPDFLVILHYLKSGSVEEIHPHVWQNETEQWYATFVLTSFSDFVMTQYIGGLYREGSKVQYFNDSNTALENVRFVVARYDADGKFLDSEVSEKMTVAANTSISYTIKNMGDNMKIMLVDENYKPLTASIS